MHKKLIIKIILIYIYLFANSYSMQSNFFDKAKKLYDEKKFEDSKILFERDLVFNPKNDKSYLYLAKIFNKKKDIEEYENNLNNVLLLKPQNDEALYLLTLLKIEQSDYSTAKDLIEKFSLVCKSFCNKKDEVEEIFSKHFSVAT